MYDLLELYGVKDLRKHRYKKLADISINDLNLENEQQNDLTRVRAKNVRSIVNMLHDDTLGYLKNNTPRSVEIICKQLRLIGVPQCCLLPVIQYELTDVEREAKQKNIQDMYLTNEITYALYIFLRNNNINRFSDFYRSGLINAVELGVAPYEGEFVHLLEDNSIYIDRSKDDSLEVGFSDPIETLQIDKETINRYKDEFSLWGDSVIAFIRWHQRRAERRYYLRTTDYWQNREILRRIGVPEICLGPVGPYSFTAPEFSEIKTGRFTPLEKLPIKKEILQGFKKIWGDSVTIEEVINGDISDCIECMYLIGLQNFTDTLSLFEEEVDTTEFADELNTWAEEIASKWPDGWERKRYLAREALRDNMPFQAANIYGELVKAIDYDELTYGPGDMIWREYACTGVMCIMAAVNAIGEEKTLLLQKGYHIIDEFCEEEEYYRDPFHDYKIRYKKPFGLVPYDFVDGDENPLGELIQLYQVMVYGLLMYANEYAALNEIQEEELDDEINEEIEDASWIAKKIGHTVINILSKIGKQWTASEDLHTRLINLGRVYLGTTTSFSLSAETRSVEVELNIKTRAAFVDKRLAFDYFKTARDFNSKEADDYLATFFNDWDVE